MKTIIFLTLFVFTNFSLIAAEQVASAKLDTSSFKPLNGAALYKQHCMVCHGAKAKKSPLENIEPIAGMDATLLARILRAYRDQDDKHGTAHSVYRESQIMKEATSSLSNQQMGAIAIYVHSLRK